MEIENNSNQPSSKQPNLNKWLPLLFSCMVVFGMLIGNRLEINKKSTNVPQSVNVQKEINHGSKPGRLEEILRYVDIKYVDEIDRQALEDKLIETLMAELDPHSNYIDADYLKTVNEQLEGNFEGVGIEFLILNDTIRVVAPIAGGPSEELGILAGDKIVMIEDSIVAGIGIESSKVIESLRGKRGSEVTIGIQRGGSEEILDFTIARAEIPIKSIDASYMLDSKNGYIKISRFSSTTYKEFMKSLEVLVEEENLENLVIDLRQNPGGYLQEATRMLSQLFKDKDKLLVYTEGRSVRRSNYESTGTNFFDIGKVAVLIDEGSASASEIMAGAIQDWDRGVVVGRRSFGKGLVQEQYKLSDGSALRLTVARYFTPSGRLIQKSYDDLSAYDQDVMTRYEAGELTDETKIIVEDTAAFYTSGGRLVHSGGGITPDEFVPLDTIVLNEQYIGLRKHLNEYVYTFVDQNPALKEYKIDDFKSNFQVDDELLEGLASFAEASGFEIDVDELDGLKAPLKRLLKAHIAKHLHGDGGYYKIWNEKDDCIKEAISIINSDQPITSSK